MAEQPVRAGPTLVTTQNTGQAILTASGGAGTWVALRDITICNETNQPATFSMGIGTSAADALGKRLEKSVTLQPGDPSYKWGGWLPLFGSATTPEILYVECDQANAVTVTVGAVGGP